MDAKPGMKIYLVTEFGGGDSGWPVSAFATKEKALEECLRLAKKNLKWRIESLRESKIHHECEIRDGNHPPGMYRKLKIGGFGTVMVGEDGEGYGWQGFQVQIYVLDKRSKWWY